MSQKSYLASEQLLLPFSAVRNENVFSNHWLDHMATIQVVQRGSTGVDKGLAGYLRTRLWVTENPNDNCRGFSLILDAC